MTTMAMLSFSFSFFFLSSTATSALADPTAAGGASNSTEFIRRSCGSTLYPNLCFNSLSRYAASVQQDPVQLARVAANITRAHVGSVSFHVATLCRTPAAGAPGRREAAALRDCADALGDAAEQSRMSAEELGRVEAAVGPEVAWRVSNAQTWMSAALTNEDTCADGFQAVGPSPLKDDVCRRVWRARQYTSNALALVNSLVAPGGRRR